MHVTHAILNGQRIRDPRPWPWRYLNAWTRARRLDSCPREDLDLLDVYLLRHQVITLRDVEHYMRDDGRT